MRIIKSQSGAEVVHPPRSSIARAVRIALVIVVAFIVIGVSLYALGGVS